MKNAKKEKAPPKVWIDAQGREIPDNYVNKSDKFADKTLKGLLKRAKSVQAQVTALKKEMFETSEKIREAILAENGRASDKTPESVTHFSFDRGVKLQVKNQKQIVFNETLINAAKDVLQNEFLANKLSKADEAVVKMIMRAFEKQNGQLNTDNILSLRQYEKQIDDPKFSEAMGLITEAIDHGRSKLYPTLYERDAKGEYELVNLNLSSL